MRFLKIKYLKLKIKKFFSKFEDASADETSRVLEEFGRINGTKATIFVIGVNNGVENDPFVEKAIKFGWQGVLVEPNRSVFEELYNQFGKLSNITCINAAIGCSKESIVLYKIAFSKKRWATGLTSSSKEILMKHFENGWVQAMCNKFNEKLPSNTDNWITSFEVPCKTVNQLALESGINALNVLAVDTEGMDAEIVNNTLDEGYRPEIICFEHLHLDPQSIESLTSRCRAYGYHVFRDANNVVLKKF